MRLCNVKTVHVFRVSAYAMTAVTPLALVSWISLLCLSELIYGAGIHAGRAAANSFYACLIGCILFIVRSIAIAYSQYIRMRHGFGVAVASQLIALLALLVTLVLWSIT